MTTVTELNGKAWYRFLKVLYVVLYLPYFLLFINVIYDLGRDYHDPIIPDTVNEVLKDPKFYNLEHYDKRKVLTKIDENLKYNIFDQLKRKYVETKSSNTPLKKKYIYKSYYTWNIQNCIIYGLLLTICYVFVLECIRRGFYYILIGKVFPKE